MTTRVISRDTAIRRIQHVTNLIHSRQFDRLDTIAFELIKPEEAVVSIPLAMSYTSLPDSIIEDTINQPFYRFHNQDTYILGDHNGN